MDNGRYYAVAVGRSTGIFLDCEEARRQVDGYSGAQWKKFSSKRAALNYLRGRRVSIQGHRPTQTTRSTRSTWTSLPPRSTEPSEPPAPRPTQTTPAFNQLDYLMGMGAPEDRSSIEYYAVYLGRFSGICSSLQTVQELLQTDQQTRVTGCATFADAEKCLGTFGMLVDPQGRLNADGSWTWPAYRRGRSLYTLPDPQKTDTLVAFCDGSAIHNGDYNCHAAFACIFPHNQSWNVVKRVMGPFATSNRAEYLAALEAIKRANLQDPEQKKTLFIFSDSELLVNSMNKWVIDWMYDGWVTSSGTPVKNRDLLQLLLEARGNDRAVHFEHVKAHTGGQDWKSRWNDVADQAARNAAQVAAQNAPPSTSRPRICMMPALAAFGGTPNVRTFRDMEKFGDDDGMVGQEDAAAV